MVVVVAVVATLARWLLYSAAFAHVERTRIWEFEERYGLVRTVRRECSVRTVGGSSVLYSRSPAFRACFRLPGDFSRFVGRSLTTVVVGERFALR